MSQYGFRATVRADLARYALADGVPLTVPLALRLILLSHGFQFVLHRRIGEALHRLPLVGRALRRVWWWLTCRAFASEIAIAAEVGPGLYIPHPVGIIVGAGRIGRDVVIQQNVTVGARDGSTPGTAEICDGAYLSAGSVIVGAITIGAGARIGANAVVLADVPPGATAVGIPARIVDARRQRVEAA